MPKFIINYPNIVVDSTITWPSSSGTIATLTDISSSTALSASYAVTASYAMNIGANGTSGTSGVNGTSGTSGDSGTSGTSGSSGTSGTSGSSGSSGTSGSSGSSGTSGANGSSGSSGTSGSSGSSGTSGTSGSTGSSGTSGSSGSSGTSGANGSSGSSGTSGSSGSGGTSGDSGTSGTSGSSGTSGTSGSSGSSGTSGSSGSSGTSGANGSSGSSGTSGANGSSGSSGTSGANGSSGSSGTAGSSGTNGTSGPNSITDGSTTYTGGITAGVLYKGGAGTVSSSQWGFGDDGRTLTVVQSATNTMLDVFNTSTSTPLTARFGGYQYAGTDPVVSIDKWYSADNAITDALRLTADPANPTVNGFGVGISFSLRNNAGTIARQSRFGTYFISNDSVTPKSAFRFELNDSSTTQTNSVDILPNGALRLYSGSNYITLSTPTGSALGSSYDLKLPTGIGSTETVLALETAAGQLKWKTVPSVPTGTSGSLLLINNNELSGSGDLLWVSASKQLIMTGSAIITGSLVINKPSSVDTNLLRVTYNNTDIFTIGPIPGTGGATPKIEGTIFLSGSYVKHLWNWNPLSTPINYSGQYDSAAVMSYGSGSETAAYPFIEYGIAGHILAGQGGAYMTSSYGGYSSPSLFSQSGSIMFEVDIVGISYGPVPIDVYAHKYVGMVNHSDPANGSLSGPDTLLFRYRTDAVWDSYLVYQTTNPRVDIFVVDNGEGSIWTGTVRMYRVNNKMGWAL